MEPGKPTSAGAELIITDSKGGGMITGGNNTGSGGGIYCAGSAIIHGGNITGNSSALWGGGIYLPDGTGAHLDMDGGDIRNNVCGKNGGGVHVSGSAGMSVSEEPAVHSNFRTEADGTLSSNNVALAGSAVISVTGALGEFADIHVTRSAGPGAFTSGYWQPTAFPPAPSSMRTEMIRRWCSAAGKPAWTHLPPELDTIRMLGPMH